MTMNQMDPQKLQEREMNRDASRSVLDKKPEPMTKDGRKNNKTESQQQSLLAPATKGSHSRSPSR